MKALIAAVLVMFATPVAAAMVDHQLADRVNREVNNEITYVDDDIHYGEVDKWVSDPFDHMGDCEDFAVTKLNRLREAGVDTVVRTRIRFVYIVHKDGSLGAHAILETRLDNGLIVFLDNRFDKLMTRRQLLSRGYIFYDW